MIRESLFLALLSWAIGLASTLLWNIGGQFESVVKVGALIFFLIGVVGILRFLYAFLFVKDMIQLPVQSTLPGASYSRQVPGHSTRAALGSPQSVPVNDYSRRSNTKEIVSPPSVTENTTRLLEDPHN